jgi:suppressor of fused protein SUFU
MANRRKISEEDRFRLWWMKTFREREDLLRERFGQTDPLGYVTSFSWSDPGLVIPGACALCFPPDETDRPHWLYLGHGLTQPLEPQPPVQGRWSGYGCEFAILTRERSSWAAEVLYQLMTYWKSQRATIGIGHRVPLAFFDRHSSGEVLPELGMVQDGELVPPEGEMRALLFWKYGLQPKPLWTSTGYFDILIGTTITEDEWHLAKKTSSAHLLLLLARAGTGQLSNLRRQTVTEDPRWSIEWEEIRTLSEEEVLPNMQEMP